MSYLKLDDYRVPGFGLKVGFTFKLKDEDASGETSSTATAKKGLKGKRLSVKVSLRYEHESQLRELMRVAEATQSGDGKKYTITNPTANAVGMRECTFSGDFKAEEDEALRKWNISFTLAEHKSVPELAESREPKKDTASTGSQGEEIGENQEPATPEKLTWFETQLKKLDEKIGSL